MRNKAFSFDTTTTPVMPTSLMTVAADGRMRGTDGSCWAYFSVPLNPTLDAKTTLKRLQASAPLMGVLSELGDMAHVSGLKRRRLQKSSYRRIQLLSINLDALFHAPPGHELEDMLNKEFSSAEHAIMRRVVLLGVRLVPQIQKTGLAASIDSVAETLFSGHAPLSDFDADFSKIRSLMARHGLASPTSAQIAIARAWWNQGNNADVAYMVEADRYHVLRTVGAARRVQRLAKEGVPLDQWPTIEGHSALTFTAVSQIDMPWTSVLAPGASWMLPLIDYGAACIAINALVEPGTITAKEIERQADGYESDVRDRLKMGKDSSHEQESKLEALSYVRGLYQGGSPPPILTETSIVVAFNGDGSHLKDTSFPFVSLAILTNRQVGAMAETWLCPRVRVNPAIHDLPLTTIGFSGVCSLSTVGDDPKGAALVGFTERDRQPAWSHPAAAMTLADSPPLHGIMGMSGSGKTMMTLWLLIQYSLLGHKTVFIDPKEGSDFTALFDYYGGTTISVGDLVASDGILDPLRFSPNPADGIVLAMSMLRFINPWGRDAIDREVGLSSALSEGVGLGARSILSALWRARDAGNPYATPELIDNIEAVASSVPFASALIGSNDDGPRLSFDSRLSMVRVGNVPLDLPSGGVNADLPLSQRVAVSLIRMLVRGSTIAVRGNEGVVGLDEAWIFFDSAGDELVSLGRLARSQSVAVFLATQRVSDVIEADLEDFLSSGWILAMSSRREAEAACRLLNLEPTQARLRRIMSGATITGSGGATAPNWDSLRALLSPDRKKVLRGSVAIFADIHDRAVTCEVALPTTFLRLASTNRLDRQRSGAVQGA